MFRCKLPPARLADCPGSFRCHCGNTGVERTPKKSQHTKLTLEKTIFPLLLPGFELATFRSRVQRSNQQAICLEELWNTYMTYLMFSMTVFCRKSSLFVLILINSHCHWRAVDLLINRLPQIFIHFTR